MPGLQGWINTAISVGTLGVMVWQTKVMQHQQLPATEAAIVAPAEYWKLYWPVGVMFALVVINAVILFKQKHRDGKGPFLRGQLIKGSGNAGIKAAVQVLNGAALSDFRRDYNVAVVCGLTDPTADKFEDSRIAKSAAFSITKAVLEIVVPYDGPMADAMSIAIDAALAQQERPGFRKPKKSKPRAVQVRAHTWTETILIPKGVDTKAITKLSDVRRLNGKILSEEIDEGRIRQIV